MPRAFGKGPGPGLALAVVLLLAVGCGALICRLHGPRCQMVLFTELLNPKPGLYTQFRV